MAPNDVIKRRNSDRISPAVLPAAVPLKRDNDLRPKLYRPNAFELRGERRKGRPPPRSRKCTFIKSTPRYVGDRAGNRVVFTRCKRTRVYVSRPTPLLHQRDTTDTVCSLCRPYGPGLHHVVKDAVGAVEVGAPADGEVAHGADGVEGRDAAALVLGGVERLVVQAVVHAHPVALLQGQAQQVDLVRGVAIALLHNDRCH